MIPFNSYIFDSVKVSRTGSPFPRPSSLPVVPRSGLFHQSASDIKYTSIRATRGEEKPRATGFLVLAWISLFNMHSCILVRFLIIPFHTFSMSDHMEEASSSGLHAPAAIPTEPPCSSSSADDQAGLRHSSPSPAVHSNTSMASPRHVSANPSLTMLALSAGGSVTPSGTPKRGGGAAQGPALVVFSGGTAFNGVAGVGPH